MIPPSVNPMLTAHAAHPLMAASGHREPLVLVGGGGHAIVVAEAAHLAGQPLSGFLDDHSSAPLAAILIDVPHPFPVPAHLGPMLAVDLIGEHLWILAIGDIRSRRGLLRSLSVRASTAASVVHPRAMVSPSAVVGTGTFIGPGAIVHSRAKIAQHAIINTGAIVEHDNVIEENVHIAPGAVLGGTVRIGHDTLVGLGSRILPGITVGKHCVIGSGAVVTRDIPDGQTVVGVPARSV